MDDAERAREAAREALADVEPDRLRAALDDRLAAARMTPGALTLVAARALDPGVDVAALAERAAGVQLIYEGLRLTRTLAHDEPWGRTDADPEADIDADLDILAADVFVSRGFYLLARSDAADRAVEVVRAFGRDQTARESADDPASLDANLEADVLDLAVVAGASAVDRDPGPALRSYADDLARREGVGFADPPTLPDGTAERITALAGGSCEDPAPATDP